MSLMMTISGEFGGILGIMPFFGNTHQEAAEGSRVNHNRSIGVDAAVFWQSHWKCIRNGENWDKIGQDIIGFWPPNELGLSNTMQDIH